MTAPRSLSDLTLEIARLRAALKPFAAIAQTYDRRPAETRLVSTVVGDINVGDLRRAATALER